MAQVGANSGRSGMYFRILQIVRIKRSIGLFVLLLLTLVLTIGCSECPTESAVELPREPTQAQLDSWAVFNEAHDDSWRIWWDELGMPSRITGIAIYPDGTSAGEKARNFLDELAGVFLVTDPGHELRLSWVDSNRYVAHVGFAEHIGGFRVFDCTIKVHLSRGEAVHDAGANACRLDNPFDYNQLLLTSGDAMWVAFFAVPEGRVQLGSFSAEAGYLPGATLNRLVWRVCVGTRNPLHEWLITIDQSGNVLETVDIIMYDGSQQL